MTNNILFTKFSSITVMETWLIDKDTLLNLIHAASGNHQLTAPQATTLSNIKEILEEELLNTSSDRGAEKEVGL